MVSNESDEGTQDCGTSPASALPSLLGISQEALENEVKAWGDKAFRARQVIEWVHRRGATTFEEMDNVPKALRGKLAEHFSLSRPEQVLNTGSDDTTQKYLFRLGDGRLIETVLIPASPALYGEASHRRTLCVSSQVGCAYGCKFCASGLAGFARNLTAAEIVGQVMEVGRLCGERIDNIVFMGMGEPLANLTNLQAALEILNAPWGVGIGARHMTVSTSGLAPQIRKLADIPMQIRLAISLHGATDEVRDQIMPVNKKYPIDELFDALEHWSSIKKQKISFEFILIAGVNDSIEQAEELVELMYSLNAKVNLIPYNTVEGLPWERPSEDQQDRFLEVLTEAGVIATIRREKGHDIAAACGQLRLQTEEGMEEGTRIAEAG